MIFIAKAETLYGYDHFVADTSGSLCEVVDPFDPADPVLRRPRRARCCRSGSAAPRRTLEALAARFDHAPKPMYYPEAFLTALWAEYRAERGLAPDAVDPDDFIRHGFRRLIAHRLPRYRAMAERWGVTVEAAEIEAVRDPQDFDELIAIALTR